MTRAYNWAGVVTVAVEDLRRFSPNFPQNEFNFSTRVLANAVGFQGNAFAFKVIVSVSLFVLVGLGPMGITAGFCFQSQPRVDVGCKQPLLSLCFGKVPRFVNAENAIALCDGLLHFGHTPCAMWSSWGHVARRSSSGLLISVSTQVRQSGKVSFPPLLHGNTGCNRHSGGNTVTLTRPKNKLTSTWSISEMTLGCPTGKMAYLFTHG